MERIHVDVQVKPLSYEVYAGAGLFPVIAEDLAEHPLGNRYAVISDSRVDGLYGDLLEQALAAKGLSCSRFVFPEGEKSKNRRVKEELEDAMLRAGLGRDCAVLALGGGVTGDLAGFVAATYMRGVPVIQIPTTTLAMADSAIGSKTAVDVPQGKNLIGAFHSPEAVYMDMSVLGTLDDRNYYAGLVELIKHSFIDDKGLAEYLNEHRAVITGPRKGTEYEHVMERLFVENSAVKNRVVMADQKEANLRKVLNYGHTLGHAVELLSGFARIHGECVAAGIGFAAFLSKELGYCSAEFCEYQRRTLKDFGMDLSLPEEISDEALAEAMSHDKKARGGRVEWVLLAGQGEFVRTDNGGYGIPVEKGTILATLQKYRKI